MSPRARAHAPSFLRIGLVTACLVVSNPSTAADPTFESHWQDGRAEMSGYRLTVTRYGAPRSGTATLITVTEPFSESRRVKVDDPKRNPQDAFEALKLNLVRDFQTGIYDYNTMASLFVRSRDLSLAKLSFSSAEWCGHVYEEMIAHRHHIADRLDSYFENESGLRRLTRRDGGIVEEELFLRLRDLRGPWLRPGERRKVPFLASGFLRRLTHRPLTWTEAVIERSRATVTVTVPAGRFPSTLYTVRVADGREGRFWIERAYPHRVLRWEWTPSGPPPRRGRSPSEGLDAGELLGSERLAYWRLNGPGDERYLRPLGLGGASRAPGGASRPSDRGRPAR